MMNIRQMGESEANIYFLENAGTGSSGYEASAWDSKPCICPMPTITGMLRQNLQKAAETLHLDHARLRCL
jgi:hypothetical protein